MLAKINFKEMIDLIFSAEDIIYYSCINIHEEIALALSEQSKKGIKVNVIMDISENSYRNGFGDFTSIKLLKEEGVKVSDLKGNRVSFVIVDDIGYFLFSQSKIFETDSPGLNAFRMNEDDQKLVRLKYFYEGYQLPEINKTYQTIINSEKNIIPEWKGKIKFNPPSDEELHRIEEELKINPPLHPELKRKLNVYQGKVQFVELKFTGSNTKICKISIPKNALPFKDARLVKLMETRMNLFDRENINNDLEELENIRRKLEKLKTKMIDGKPNEGLLISVSCREKNIIKIKDKQMFSDALNQIKDELQNYKKRAGENLEKEILKKKGLLRNELLDFFRANPPEDYSNYTNDTLFDKIEDKINIIVSKIKFPEVKSILGHLEIVCNFYDLTFEDFRDQKLLEELREKEILKSDEIEDIVSFLPAVEMKK